MPSPPELMEVPTNSEATVFPFSPSKSAIRLFAQFLWMSPARVTMFRTFRSWTCLRSARLSNSYPGHWSILWVTPSPYFRSARAIMTCWARTFQAVFDRASPLRSHSRWALPRIVPLGFMTSGLGGLFPFPAG